MKNSEFEDIIEKKLGNYKLLPDYPFKENVTYAIFPGGMDKFIDRTTYKILFELNAKYGNSELVSKPHFSNINNKKLFLHQTEYNWQAFSDMQEEHMSCEGIYLCGNSLNWLGIYHYDDYLLVGGPTEFINELCILMIGSTNWKDMFIKAYELGDVSMYKSDFDILLKKLF